MSEGYVYILKNEAMPGYYKIGLTERRDVNVRVRELYTTAMPLPFEIHYAARVPDCKKLEKTLHFVFGEFRTRKDREFFTIDPGLAKAIIELVAIEEETFSDAQQDISPADRQEIEKKKRQRSERMTLERLGLPVGTVLTFSKDPAITCSVAGARTVLFNGEEQSLSQAALTAVHGMGYAWTAISGFEYWTTA